MHRLLCSIALLLAVVAARAQGTMNIHWTDGTTGLLDMSAIDSVTYPLQPPGVMVVYHTGAGVLNFQVADIDSVTYSPGGPPGTAQVATRSPGIVGSTTAQCSGMVGLPGGSAVVSKGICYGTAPMPDLSGSYSTAQAGGSGPITRNLTALLPNTLYYARAFATNDQGTTYGNQISFFTPQLSFLNQDLTYGSATDQDGNAFATIVIGSQEWMAEDLRVTTYANGDTIPHVTVNSVWSQLTEGAWVYYDNISSYGKLYNWYTVNDPRNVCPTGWHVPVDAEWIVLRDLLGGGSEAGGKLKSAGTQYWMSPNAGATNESGFSGLPGGYGDSEFLSFWNYGERGYWWSASAMNPSSAWYWTLGYSSTSFFKDDFLKQTGCTVRCVRD